uniref:Uncharacterized protein n=1 Tax=Anguilla anguilla TaxID=7936 RepID=A0A0E9UX21_ANGAN
MNVRQSYKKESTRLPAIPLTSRSSCN